METFYLGEVGIKVYILIKYLSNGALFQALRIFQAKPFTTSSALALPLLYP